MDNGLGFNGGIQVGNPLNSNLLFPVIVGLGLLSLFNIVLTVVVPLLSPDDTADDTPTERAHRGLKMVELAQEVYSAIQNMQQKHE